MPKPVFVIRQVEHEGVGTIADALAAVGVEPRYCDAFAGDLPAFDPDHAAGLILMGGAMNVDETDKYPFLDEEIRWIDRALQAGLPILGVCLGAQLLAKALGARVTANHQKEIGWYEIQLTSEAADDRLLSHCRHREIVFQWHGDTFEMPQGAVHLATSELCRHQAFRYGTAAYGLQFHLEVTEAIIRYWLREPEMCGDLNSPPGFSAEQIAADIPRYLPPMTDLASHVFREFVQLCRSHAES